MGHIVGQDGVRMDPKKIQAMWEWPCPKTLKSHPGFLGFTQNSQKFVYNYGKIVGPLTKLLEKNSLVWNDAMCLTPVLVVHAFTKPLVLNYNASRT